MASTEIKYELYKSLACLRPGNASSSGSLIAFSSSLRIKWYKFFVGYFLFDGINFCYISFELENCYQPNNPLDYTTSLHTTYSTTSLLNANYILSSFKYQVSQYEVWYVYCIHFCCRRFHIGNYRPLENPSIKAGRVVIQQRTTGS